MSPQEGTHQKFEVKIDDNGDFKIISGNNEAPKMMATEPKGSVTTHVARRRKHPKPFIPSGVPKETVKKIKLSIATQRIAEYVHNVSPNDGCVDEKAFLGYIKWQMHKKHPQRYLDVVKEKGIMVPCGEGKLKFTRRM